MILTFFLVPWAIHRFFHSIRTSVTQTSDSPLHSGLGSDLRPALGRLKQLAVDAILYRGKDALREEVAPSIGFVLDTRFLGSRFEPQIL